MAEYIIDNVTLEGLANKVRTLGGISTQLSTNAIIENLQYSNSEISKQSDLINHIQDRITNGIIDKLIDRTISGDITDKTIDNVGNYAFYNCSSLTSVNFPVCSYIGNSAFRSCSSLTSVNFPACTNISGYAFYGCTKLTSINFPACTNISSYAFYGCTKLTSINFPACINIGGSAFQNCSSLTSVNFPACTSIGSSAFRQCSSLTSVNLPACTNIDGGVFYNCYRLSTIILGASSICTLVTSTALSSTPYAGYKTYFGGTPYIYVPSSLLTSYKTATNWTYFSNYFSTIESM